MKLIKMTYKKLLSTTFITDEMNIPYHKAFMKFSEPIPDLRNLYVYRYWLRLMLNLYNKYNKHNPNETFEDFVYKDFLLQDLITQLKNFKIDI